MGGEAHWFLPVNPAAHPEHMPADWLTREDATAVWGAVGRSQRIDRWCLRTGFRTMKPGDVVWAYLSRRQELCAVGTVRRTALESADGVELATGPGSAGGGPDAAPADPGSGWYVYVDWDQQRTAALCRRPVPRSEFGQVPMSVCRAGKSARDTLERAYLPATRGGTELEVF